MTNAMNFEDVTPIEIDVTIAGQSYVLREATEQVAVVYRNAQLRALSLKDGKVSKVDNAANVEPLLVSLCLYKVNTDKDGNKVVSPTPVSLSVINGMRPRIVKQLYEKAKEISWLNEEAETLESLIKQRDKLNKLIEEMQSGEDDAGN
jgi:uncharacterized protein (UPF0128 family)